MFLKLFKYDFKNIFKMLLPAYIAYAGLGIIAIVANIVYIMSGVSDGVDTISQTSLMIIRLTTTVNSLFELGTNIVTFYSVIAVYIRFVRNMFKDEGYLTHTLPISSHKLLLSKYAVNFVFMIISGLVVGVMSFLVNLPIAISHESMLDVLKQLIEEIFGTEVNVDIGHQIVIIVLSVEIVIASPSVLFTCFSIGYSSNKRKMFKSILCLILFYFILISLFMFYSSLIIFIRFENFLQIDFYYVFTLPIVVVLGVVDVGGYFLSHHFITKKLNLE